MLHPHNAYEFLIYFAKNYVESLLTPEYNRLGFIEKTTDSILEKSHRVHILKWACKIGLPDCVQNSVKLFKDWMESGGGAAKNP
jgi:aminopeptidase N